MPTDKQKKATLLRVVDGDTVEVALGNGLFRRPKTARIRLYGIDAPESSQKGGTESTKELRRLCGNPKARLWLQPMNTDQYGRIVATLWKRGGIAFLPGPAPHPDNSINYRMVENGQAECYMLRGPDTALYREAERNARKHRWGMWRDHRHESPRDYRRKQREDDESKANLRLQITLALLALSGLAAAAAYMLHRSGNLQVPGLTG